jgi:heme oxygenase
MILDNQQLKFYQWAGDVSALLDAVRGKINTLAEGWTREQKDHCLQETMDTFKVSRGDASAASLWALGCLQA